MATIEVKVPDIGDFKDVPVIEVLVKPGEAIKTEQSLVTLESDKATMDVPSPLDGVVREIKVKVGDKVSEGAVLLTAETEAAPAGVGASREGERRRPLHRRRRADRRLRRGVGRIRDARGAGPRHRRLQGRPGHRGVRQAGRRDQARGAARLARVRQGDDGCAVARGGDGEGGEGQARRQGERGQPPPHVDDGCERRRPGRPRGADGDTGRTGRRADRRNLRRRARTSSARCSCLAPVLVGTPPRSARRTSA